VSLGGRWTLSSKATKWTRSVAVDFGQVAETEKTNLEGAKMEAEALLAAERDVLQKKWLLHHVRIVVAV
jgi:hypothetical protein